MAGAPVPLSSGTLERRTLGKYEVLSRLSTGGMSQIYLAHQRGVAGFKKIVVLKSILPDIRGEEEFVHMFLDEAKITAAFNHPNIAQVFDLDVDAGELFLAMEFVPGCTLVEVARACRANQEPIPMGFTLMAVRDTALALHYAHTFTDPLGRKQVVIHRDVAEKNIMVTYEGTTKLLDFGIAKALNRIGRTSVGLVKGTSGYMSPEQILGEQLDARSDVFSLGVVLHECLTGMRLFHAKNAEEAMHAALKANVAPPSKQNPAVPPALDEVVLKALRRERDDRFATALELGRALERSAGSLFWLPEQSGELVQRLFAERREQTRKLFEQARSETGELTGEIRIDQLLSTRGNPPTPPNKPSISISDAPTPAAGSRGSRPSIPPEPPEHDPEVLTVPSGMSPAAVLAAPPPPPATNDRWDDVTDDDVVHSEAKTIVGDLSQFEPETAKGTKVSTGRRIIGIALLLSACVGLLVVTGVYRRLPYFTKRPATSTAPVDAEKAAAEKAAAEKAAAEKAAAEKAAAEKAAAEKAAAEKAAAEKAAAEKAAAEKAAAEKAAAEKAAAEKAAAEKAAAEKASKLTRSTRPPRRPATRTKAPVAVDKPRPAPGFLTLVALPFAQVLLGSQDLGPTPLHKTQLPAGKHRLRLIGENGQQYVLPVEISSGETTKLKVMLEELDPG